MLLVGCTIKGLEDMYILSQSYTDTSATPQDSLQTNTNISTFIADLTQNKTSLEIRIGCFGFCLLDGRLRPTALCLSSMSSLASVVQNLGVSSDPLNLLPMAEKFQSSTIFSGLM